MIDEHQEKLTHYLAAFIEELVGNGVDEVVISPGSRSTPLALLFAHHPGVKTYTNVDERSAAFFGLGIARAKKKPVAILCSSGTAGANYYPAVIEARYGKVPLIVLTADRPHELREVGAPQAINQIDLYGKHVKWSVDMALPESIPSMVKYARSSAARGVSISTGYPQGPVHYNFPFREPLIPNLQHVEFTSYQSVKTVIQGDRQLPSGYQHDLLDQLKKSNRGIVVCGPGIGEDAVQSIIAFAEEYGLPILADPLSFVRNGSHSKGNIMDCYDTFIRVDELKESLHPDLVIRFGAMPVSKALMLFLKSMPDIPTWVVSNGEEWQDPTARGTHYIQCEENLFCQAFIGKNDKPDREWLEYWVGVNDETKGLLNDGHESWDEGKAVHHLIRHLPDGATLFSSNSMPIRDLDTFLFTDDRSIRIFANRGANGIDGVVSTALGMSTGSQSMYLLIGDLAFFHDLNGLLTARKYQLDMTIIVMNNNGGGIFSYLPQASDQTHFEDLFGTPMDLDFAHAAKLYGAGYSKVSAEEEFIPALMEADQYKGINIIEVMTNREENVANHRKLWNFVSREMTRKMKGGYRDSSSE